MIVMATLPVPVPLALVALRLIVVGPPAAVGVPEINPVVALNANPAGSVPVSAKLVGLLVAVIW